MKSIHIAFEGIDGAGKTSLRKMLEDYLGNNCKVVGQHSWLHPEYANVILNTREKRYKYKTTEIINAYIHDKYYLNKYILRESRKVIISDRSFISDCVYLSSLYGINEVELFSKYMEFMNLPDLIFYIDTNVKTAIERIESRNKTTRHYENLVDLTKIKSKYIGLFEHYKTDLNGRLFNINNNLSLEDSIVKIINRLPYANIPTEIAT